MLFHKSHDTKIGPVPALLLNGVAFQRVYQFRYIGVFLDPHLSFMNHFASVKSRLSSSIGKVQSVKRYVAESTMNIMFNAYVFSIYDYCMEVWCVQPDTELIRIQSKINRFLLCYTYPTFFKKYKRAPTSHSLHSCQVFNLNQVLLKFNMLSVCERLNWILLKNALCYLISTVPGLDTFFSLTSKSYNPSNHFTVLGVLCTRADPGHSAPFVRAR